MAASFSVTSDGFSKTAIEPSASLPMRFSAGSELPRIVFCDIMVPHQGPAAQAGDVALRMVEAGVDAIGIHLQSDARRANPKSPYACRWAPVADV